MKRLLVALVPLLCGCGSTVLIHDDDATFRHASERLVRTSETVQATEASPGERASFLQAEAIYRYRFTPRGKGGAATTAELAAAATDFPVFQSLAGSLDLVDLRLRSADAAIQLWESFAARYPQSRLRALALYRLGWAYHNAGAAGLPRDSGEEAFDELAHCGPPPEIAPYVAAARAVPYKTKDAASWWSIVPGLGQLYVGEPVNGAVRLAIALAAAAAIITPAVIGLTRSDELSWRHDWPLLAIGIGGLIVLSADYTSSYQDAMRGVVEWNERHERDFENAHPDAP